MVNFKGENVDQFFIDNYKLVLYFINKFTSGYSYNKKNELIENAVLLYQRCIYLYDSSKGFQFSTYLSKFLRYYVLQNITKESKTFHDRMDSLDRVICDDGKITLLDFAESGADTERTALIKMTIEYVNKNLNSRDRAIFMKHLEGTKQYEIAKEFNVSPAHISRIISKIQKELKNEFLVTS